MTEPASQFELSGLTTPDHRVKSRPSVWSEPTLVPVLRQDRALQILVCLEAGPVRFSVIARAIPGLSHKSLAAILHVLGRDGLALRHPYATIPPRVYYQLTPVGRKLLDVLRSVNAWERENADYVCASRKTYAEQSQ